MELYSVLVTGANRGIGLEFVRQLLELRPPPKHLFATYRSDRNLQNLKRLKDVQPHTDLHILKLDVIDSDHIENVKSFVEDVVKDRGLTLLINNAGVSEPQVFPNITPENLNYHFSTNTVAPIMITQAMYPLLKISAERHKGEGMSFSKAAVLNISSLAASVQNTGVKFIEDLVVTCYKISKAGLNMAMRVIAVKVKPDNILVINMCPGYVKTDITKGYGDIEPKESIADMLETISKLNETHNGFYIDRKGKPLPY